MSEFKHLSLREGVHAPDNVRRCFVEIAPCGISHTGTPIEQSVAVSVPNVAVLMFALNMQIVPSSSLPLVCNLSKYKTMGKAQC